MSIERKNITCTGDEVIPSRKRPGIAYQDNKHKKTHQRLMVKFGTYDKIYQANKGNSECPVEQGMMNTSLSFHLPL